jgi:cobalt/nickel transport protein
MKTTGKLSIALGALAILSPVGLILPEIAKAGSAWGEWGTGEISDACGYVPSGLAKISALWSAALPDYAFPGWEDKGLAALSLSYVASALIGIALCVGAAFLLGKLLAKKDRKP